MSPAFVSTSFALAGVAATAWLVRRRALQQGLSLRVAVDGLFVMLAAGLLAGHVVFLVLYRAEALSQDWTLLVPGSGGACSLGMLSGALLAGAVFFAWGKRPRAFDYLDTVAWAGSLGWAIGRLGCFAIHDHVSGPHDLGLYEALVCFALFGVLSLLARSATVPGRILVLAAVGYGSARFLLDFLRHGELRWAGLTPMQVAIALGAVVASVAWFAQSKERARSRHTSLVQS